MSQIGPRLRALRTQHGLSIEKLAARAGVTSATVSRIERGRNSPDLATLEALAKALDIAVIDLIGNDDELTEGVR